MICEKLSTTSNKLLILFESNQSSINDCLDVKHGPHNFLSLLCLPLGHRRSEHIGNVFLERN